MGGVDETTEDTEGTEKKWVIASDTYGKPKGRADLQSFFCASVLSVPSVV